MLSPSENIILRNFAEQLKAEIQKAIKTKKVTKFGAVHSSGRLHDSIEIRYTENGFQILGNDYIDGLIWGVRPGESKATTTDLARWIDEKPIKSSVPTDSLAALMLRAQQKEGNMVWRTHKGANSGLLEDALSDDKFDNFIDLLASASVEELTDAIVSSYELAVA
jgi:hypothetical protein